MWATVDTLRPQLGWSYSDVSCEPENYRVHLRTGPLFIHELGGETGDPFTSWTPEGDLEPGTEYGWVVRALTGEDAGPPAGYRYFFTGPLCGNGTLAAPVLLEPSDDVVDELEPSFKWDYPDPCLVQGYRIDLSTSIEFEEGALGGGTGNPSTRWGTGIPLTDCTRYYWRVAGVDDAGLGPYSDVGTFRVDTTGTCP